MPEKGQPPRLILAADHRARGIITVESYEELVKSLRAALAHCDGVMATVQPLGDLMAQARQAGLRTYLSLNRTGLAGSVFELDDRLVATAERASRDGYTGIKLMCRMDLRSPETSAALELLGRVLEEARSLGLEALIEPLTWRDGAVDRTPEGIVFAAAIAHDMGAPLLKVPVPAVPAGDARVEAVARVTASVGVPVLFLGGPRSASRREVLAEIADAMAGRAGGMAIGRAVYQDQDPARMAGLVADLVHRRRPVDEVLAQVTRGEDEAAGT